MRFNLFRFLRLHRRWFHHPKRHRNNVCWNARLFSRCHLSISKKNFAGSKASSVVPITKVSNVSTKVNIYTKISGYHEIDIQNKSKNKLIYKIHIGLTCDSFVYNKNMVIEVTAGGCFMQSLESNLVSVVEHQVGNYRILARTQIAPNLIQDANATLFVTR